MSNTDDQLVADYLRRLTAAAASLPADRRDELIEEISAHIAEARAVGQDATGEATEGEPRTSVADTLARLGEPDDIVRAAAEQADPGRPGGPADSRLAGGGHVPGWPTGADGEPIAGGPGAGSPGGYSPGGYSPGGYSPGGYSPGGYSPGGYSPGGYGPGGAYPSWPGSSGPRRPAAGMGVMEIFAVILLLVGGFLAGIGWIVGAILLWISPRWRLSDKLLGTLIWPGGLAAVFVVLSGAAFFATSPVSACYGSSGGSNQPTTQHCVNPPGTVPGWLGVTLLLATLVVAIGGPVLVAVRLVRQARRAERHYPAAA